MMGIAQTGTGKTLAYGIPLIQRLAQTSGIGLVVLPTRELALQVNEAFQKIGKHIGLRTAVLIGGASMYNQIQDIRKLPHVLIVTPGRLIDHLEQKNRQIGSRKNPRARRSGSNVGHGIRAANKTNTPTTSDGSTNHAFFGDHADNDRKNRGVIHETTGKSRDRAIRNSR